MEVYIGSFRKDCDAAIIRCSFDENTGRLAEVGRYYTVCPSYLSISQDHRTLFCVQETAAINGVPGGGVESVDVSGDRMCRVSFQSTLAGGPTHLCTDGNYLFAADYGEGALTQLALDGREIRPVCRHIQFSGHGTDPVRQSSPHPHFVSLTPDGRYLALCDLGLNRIMVYPYSREDGISLNAKCIPVPDGQGPRHLVFSPDTKRMYVVTEMANTLLTYAFFGNGTVELMDIQSTLPKDCRKESACSAIRLSPDCREIAVGNRGHDSIAFFNIGDDGIPVWKGHVPTSSWPRDIEYSPDGQWLLCAAQNANCIDVFQLVGDTYLPAESRAVPRPDLRFAADNMPCCIVFG